MNRLRFVVFIALATLTSCSRNPAEPEVHLIPAGYVGEVTIVFHIASGEIPAREGAARLYRIPENGILLTQAAMNIGLNPAFRFFSVAADGTRAPILRIETSTVHDTPENRA